MKMSKPIFIQIPEGKHIEEYTRGFVVEFEETQTHFDSQRVGDKRGFIIIDDVRYNVRWNEDRVLTRRDAEEGKTYLECIGNKTIFEVTSQKRVLPR